MQSFRIQVSGSEEKTFLCDSGDTLLRAALRSGSGLKYECNSGGCGTCQIELVEGDVKELWPDAPGLSARAKARGKRLACQCVPLSDCTIKAALHECDAPVIVPQYEVLTYVGCHQLTPDMAEFRFRATHAANFRPGQFAMVSFPGVDGPRAYSMSNLPNPQGEWNFVIKRVSGGKGTAVLFDAMKPGDTVKIDAPYGNSYLRADNGRDIVCIAGGSGLSPVLAILRGAVRAPELSDRKLYLFYGGRGPQDICVSEVIGSDPELQKRVILHTAISDDGALGAAQWSGKRGFVHQLVKDILGARILAFDYYFCGPPPMTDAVQRMLQLEYKVPTDQLYFDRFF